MSKNYNALTVRLLRNTVLINILRVGIIETRYRIQIIKSALIDVLDNMNNEKKSSRSSRELCKHAIFLFRGVPYGGKFQVSST